MSDTANSFSSRLRKVVRLLAIAGGVIVLIFVVYPKIITGDYADVIIKSVAASSSGDVTLRIATTASADTPVLIQIFKDRKYVGGIRDDGHGGWWRRPVNRLNVVSFDLNPEKTPVNGNFEDSPLFKRLLVQPGKIYHLRGEETLRLFDFQTADGTRYSGFVQARASLSGI